MMTQSRAESTRDTYNYGQYLNHFPPNTIKVIREYERIQKKICRHKMSIMFNEICIYIYIYIYIYICIYICVCVCVCGKSNSFQDILYRHLSCCRPLKVQYLIALHLIRWQTNFYDFRYKATGKVGIGIHPTKAWLSQLVKFKNAIWTCLLTQTY